MHHLLARQLNRSLGNASELSDALRPLLQAISSYYDEIDQERHLLENALAVNSEELTQVNEQLRAMSRQEYVLRRSVFDAIPDLVWLKNPQGEYLACNPAFERFFGAREADIVGKTDYHFVETELADLFRYNDQQAIDSGHSHTNQEWITFADDGHRALVQTTKTAMYADDGALIGVLGVAHDITQLKQIEETLKESEARFRHVVESAPMGMHFYQLNPAGELIFTDANPVADQILGVDNRQFVGQTIEQAFPPLAGTHIPTRYKQIARDGGVLTDEQIRYRHGAIDGAFEIHAFQVAPNRMTVFFEDVTERKKQEDALRLAASVYQNSREGMMIADQKGNIVDVNPAFTTITGYGLDEVLGRNPRIFGSGRQDRPFYLAMWRGLKSTGFWQGEIWNRRKDGTLFAEWLSITTLRNPDGSVHRYIALFTDITEKKRSEEMIWRQANFDLLTGLPNRRMFLDRLGQELKQAHREQQQMALLFLDLDRFKEVNDTLGHHVGDELLVEAARRISACVRESDTVARLGGDEFVIVLSNVRDPCDVEAIAGMLIERLAAVFELGGEEIFISASIGITLYPADATQLEQLLQNADQAMYVAKNGGRNRFSYFTPSLQEAAQMRLRLSSELRGALAGEQFKVYVQPIVELGSGRIFKAEALLRWLHPVLGMVSPMKFIPLAEETGLINEIGDWVFRETARWIKRWQDNIGQTIQVSVNKSPVQFQTAGSLERWQAYLDEAALQGQSIAIEITEGLLLNARSEVMDRLLQYRDAGVQISIDDFGTGYSALSYLKKFNIDYLKIDQSFVRNMATDGADLALCEAIVVMAHKLGLKVIAEGVETELQRDLLTDMGCDFGQGYWFARPMPAEQFEQFLLDSAGG